MPSTNPAYLRHKDLGRVITRSLRDHIAGAKPRKFKNGKKARYEVLLGCSIPFYMDWLATQFRDGMTWENYGDLWEIDHTLERWEFDPFDEEDVLKCYHYTNTRPLLRGEHHARNTMNNIWRGTNPTI